MATVEVDIDIEDHLDEVPLDCLQNEVARRLKKKGHDPSAPEPWTRRGMADDIRQAYYARNASRLELLLSQLELREFA